MGAVFAVWFLVLEDGLKSHTTVSSQADHRLFSSVEAKCLTAYGRCLSQAQNAQRGSLCPTEEQRLEHSPDPWKGFALLKSTRSQP